MALVQSEPPLLAGTHLFGPAITMDDLLRCRPSPLAPYGMKHCQVWLVHLVRARVTVICDQDGMDDCIEEHSQITPVRCSGGLALHNVIFVYPSHLTIPILSILSIFLPTMKLSAHPHRMTSSSSVTGVSQSGVVILNGKHVLRTTWATVIHVSRVVDHLVMGLKPEGSLESEEHDRDTLVMRKARALDKAMEDCIITHKAFASSITSTGSGVGMGAIWRSCYGSRKRTGSISSNKTNGSIISEDLVGEQEDQESLGIGGGFNDEEAHSRRSSGLEDSPVSKYPDDEIEQTIDVLPVVAFAQPPSAPVWRSSFQNLPPPATAVQTSFDLPPHCLKCRPLPITMLPPVQSSPITLIVRPEQPLPFFKPVVRQRAESRTPIASSQ
ncbi:uncharacterized protein LACBIDRAFT_323963 [Laccaria bicolor S238N-H82]|uniref:Predicted protein n=1 Tax=Laccaria bicolor (strain S238N-H82 / ATCC MYA-4686) TaxID=486041 RepID=B0D069_LACBS|nr:uncharacterized protein LACBIDRAFT_323963 [Laccaria bicolor S238N-H82]EDR11777.1 predicted protein [Laccaria bicolor S238N-H82]|eukprot:XP_001877674.1 predicted protein [Laccaria bicolor S238N-H82]